MNIENIIIGVFVFILLFIIEELIFDLFGLKKIVISSIVTSSVTKKSTTPRPTTPRPTTPSATTPSATTPSATTPSATTPSATTPSATTPAPSLKFSNYIPKQLIVAVTGGSVFCTTGSSWDQKKLELPLGNGVSMITQFMDGMIVAVTSDGRVACKTRYNLPNTPPEWDFTKIELTSVSKITQLMDGTIVAVLKDGRVSCKTNYNENWDLNKISSGDVSMITQFMDGMIVAVKTDGRIACKTNYNENWSFDKIKSIESQGVRMIIQLTDGTIVAVTTERRIYSKTNYSEQWKLDANNNKSIEMISQLKDGTIIAVTSNGTLVRKRSFIEPWDPQLILPQLNFGVTQILGIYDLDDYKYSYTKKDGYDPTGKTTGTFSNRTVRDCQIECDKKTDCAGIIYRSSDKTCWHVNEFDETQMKNVNYDSYYRKNNYILKEGLDQSGATINPPGALSNIEVSTCQRICDMNPNCSGIVYRPSDKVCWNVTGFDVNQVKDDRYQSYHKNPNITEFFSNDT
jgi:hypothetical protein